MASLFEYFFGTGFWYVIIWLFFNSFMTEAVEANQWIGFYMMTASVMKELIEIYWLLDATNLDMLTITLFNNTLFFISSAFFQISLSIQFKISNP